jgi:hypothetical protein
MNIAEVIGIFLNLLSFELNAVYIGIRIRDDCRLVDYIVNILFCIGNVVLISLLYVGK